MENGSRRILSIDALRGFDMIWIMGFGMFVKLAGRATGTDIGSTIADQMEHVIVDTAPLRLGDGDQLFIQLLVDAHGEYGFVFHNTVLSLPVSAGFFIIIPFSCRRGIVIV